MSGPIRRQSQYEEPLWDKQVRIPPEELIVGHFVARMDLDWSESPFLNQGQMIETPDHKAWFERYCAWVIVDLDRSLRKKLAPIGSSQTNRSKASVTSLNLSGASIDPYTPSNSPSPTALVGQPAMEAALRSYVELDHQARRLIETVTKGGSVDVEGTNHAITTLETMLKNNLSALVWLTRIKQKDNYTAQHCINVAILSIGLARALEWSDSLVEQAGLVGLLHDLGKVRVHENILNKSGSLTHEEFEQLKRHSQYGYDLLEADENIQPEVTLAILDHHERPDGRGYPNGKKIGEYSALGALVAVADAYDAITSHRVYDSARSHHEALSILWRQRGTQFEDTIVEAFTEFMGWITPGTLVRMSNNSIAVVLQIKKGQRLSPVVQILVDTDNGYTLGARVDLAQLSSGKGRKPLYIADVLPEADEGDDVQSLWLTLL